jgi:predicted acylesterase/phospholipase RssA
VDHVRWRDFPWLEPVPIDYVAGSSVGSIIAHFIARDRPGSLENYLTNQLVEDITPGFISTRVPEF